MNYSIQHEGGLYAMSVGMAHLTVVTYPQRLTRFAKNLIDLKEFGIAVVVLHMAAEIAVDRRLSQEFASRGIADLEGPIGDFLSGYNLANDRIRKLFLALTGDQIDKQAFWPGFKESAARRNRIAHDAAIVGEQEAADSLAAVSALLRHLGHEV